MNEIFFVLLSSIKVCFIHSCMILWLKFFIFVHYWDNTRKKAFSSWTCPFLRNKIFVKISQLKEHKILFCTCILKWNVKFVYSCSVDKYNVKCWVFVFLHARIKQEYVQRLVKQNFFCFFMMCWISKKEKKTFSCCLSRKQNFFL